MYQSAALILRYVFVLAGVFMAARAVYMTVRDSGRGAYLRSSSYKTGAVAVLYFKDARYGIRSQTLPRECLVGAGRNCDARITGVGLERRHFYAEMIDCKLRITPIGAASVGTEKDIPVKEGVEIAPGEYFFAGDTKFRYIVLRAKAKPLSPMTKRAYGKAIRHVLRPKRQET